MRCRNCGHQNPEQNRYCGMCGHLVAQSAAEPEYVVEKVSTAAEPAVRSGEAAKVARADTGRKAREAEAPPVAEAPRRNDKWWVEDGESETTVGGPSFLGLGSSDSEDGYSYLFEGEERSHKGSWVFLLVLLVMGGVLYARWQPIRDYVLTTALSHSRPQPPPAQDAKSAQIPGGSAPTTTLASSDAPSQPPITTENKPAQPAKEGLPQQDKGKTPAADKADDNTGDPSPAAEPATSKQAGKKAPAAPEEASAGRTDDEGASAAHEDRAPSAKQARAQPDNPGSELVNSGERYLYGRGVVRNCSQAVSYFNAAAAKQNPQAFSHLGALYATGECVPMDLAVAYAWFRRAYAKEPGNHYFEQNLTMLWREMTPGERQRATGRRTSSF